MRCRHARRLRSAALASAGAACQSSACNKTAEEAASMIVDMRTYTLHPGNLGAYFKLYGTEGFPVQTGHLGAPLGYYWVEIGVGVQNRIVHVWGYNDIKER